MNFCVPVAEQETVINIFRAEDQIRIYTTDPTTMTKLDKLVANYEAYTLERVDRVEGAIVAKSYICDNKRLLSFRPAARIMSDEAKAAATERVQAAARSYRAT